MNVKEGKEGFGHLIDWVVRFGDLLLINTFFLLIFTIFQNDEPIVQLHYREKIITFLVINLCYFFTSSFIRFHIAFNVVSLERIVQQSSVFIALYAVFVTISLLIFNIINVSPLVWIGGFFVLGTLFVGWHILFRLMLKAYRRRGFNFRRIIIVGGGINGIKAYESFIISDFGYKVLGVFDDGEAQESILPQKYLGTIRDIEEFIKENKVDDMFCALPGSQEDTISKLIILSEKNMIRFHLIPEYNKFFKRRFSLHFVESTPVLSLRYEPLQYFSNRFVKRTFDIVFSLLMLIFIFPFIYIIFGILIKAESPGPIFFKQKRTGIKGKEFNCYKFRSMRQNKEANKLQAVKNDPRVTKIGAFMRKTSIDELPQFINVLKNDMSIVGPRPHMLQHTALYSSLIDKFMVRHLVKPGITGWAQVNGCRGETKTVEDMESRVIRDVWYLENWTFFLDLKIIFLTVYNAIRGEKNAY